MDHRRNNPKAISTSIPKQQTASRAIGSRLSTQQKLMLERLMNKAQNGHTSHDSKEQQWSKIAHQLNQVPGARKSWMQWRQVIFSYATYTFLGFKELLLRRRGVI